MYDHRRIVGLKTFGFDDSRGSAVKQLIMGVTRRWALYPDQIAKERKPLLLSGGWVHVPLSDGGSEGLIDLALHRNSDGAIA
ncbi:hypothetical protein JQ567_29885 [Bradyrhizobium sp. AUGA SZCCT0431]|nr:hypothetical protein [Bradyrhizobium sp. AUGA SZCCT0431]MBR1147508.1 hypothetical protein [Bradyrhizobium sp. AUGA SZCCT0431]